MLAHAAYFSTDSGIRASEGALDCSDKDNNREAMFTKAMADGKVRKYMMSS